MGAMQDYRILGRIKEQEEHSVGFLSEFPSTNFCLLLSLAYVLLLRSPESSGRSLLWLFKRLAQKGQRAY